MNPQVEDSPEEVEDISDNEDRNDAEDTPVGQILPVEVIPEELPNRDPNLMQKRFRHSIRNERRNYYKLYYKGFTKVARVTVLINGLDEPYTYKEAINSPEREQWLQAIQSE